MTESNGKISDRHTLTDGKGTRKEGSNNTGRGYSKPTSFSTTTVAVSAVASNSHMACMRKCAGTKLYIVFAVHQQVTIR